MARIIVPALLLFLLALAGCARINNPEGWSGSAVQGNSLFTGTTQGEIISLDKTNGETIWRFGLQGEEDDRAIYGTPAISGDSLYVGGYDGLLYSLSLDGSEKWIERLDGPVVGGAALFDGFLVVGSEVDDPVDGNEGMVYGFDAETGERQWRFPVEGKVWSTPAISDGLVIFGSLDHRVYALNLTDGKRVWTFDTGGAVAASPVVARGRVYVGSFDGVFYAINASSGVEEWRFDGASNWFWAQALVAQGIVYAPSLDGNLYALGATTGDLLWKLETDGPIVGTPAIVHGDLIAVPSTDGRLIIARLSDGTLEQSCNIDEEIRTPLFEQDGMIYFGARDKSIRAISISVNGNPDEEWVHFTDRDDPVARDRIRAC
ncbi:MAG: PQQ-binding-like beta-propeller repeat protein [Chloroflexi bacterium]|nr:PQQ-binding-like beta-propeller repeat protein [Chloroflexota bacterium]